MTDNYLPSPELPVTGIPQAGQDVAALVQLLVDTRQVDGHVRMGLLQAVHALV